MSGVFDSIFGSDDAADAALEGSQLAVDAQREALEYLQERETLPRLYSEGALGALGGYYGLPDEEGNIAGQQAIIDQVMESPMYATLAEQGEEAVLRNAAMTGGLRSGNVQEALAQNQQNVLNSLVGQRLSGLSSLAGLGSYAPQIASTISGIGQTQGQGLIASAQAQQATNQGATSNILGLGGLGLQAWNAFSDKRLKKNISFVEEVNGNRYYIWEWNDTAQELYGLLGEDYGVIAQEVEEKTPSAVTVDSNGYKQVNYAMI